MIFRLVVPGILKKDFNCSKKFAIDHAVSLAHQYGSRVFVYRPSSFHPSHFLNGKLVHVVVL